MDLNDLNPALVARMSENAFKEWVSTVVTRMGIPIEAFEAGSEEYDAEITLGGEYEHCRITFAPGSYAVWAYNPFQDDDYIIDGTGSLARELRDAKRLSLDTNI
jgi:hypothetical protein